MVKLPEHRIKLPRRRRATICSKVIFTVISFFSRMEAYITVIASTYCPSLAATLWE
jgi:hypothetical protein